MNLKIPHINPDVKLLLVKVLVNKKFDQINPDTTQINRSVD